MRIIKLFFNDFRLTVRYNNENRLTVIFNELLSRDFNVDVRLVIVNQKDSNDQNIRKQFEVDFVCNKGSDHYSQSLSSTIANAADKYF